MRQDVPNVNLTPVVVDGCDEPGLVPANIENRELADFICMRKNRADLLNAGKTRNPHLLEPLDEARSAARVQPSELVKPFARDNMHLVRFEQLLVL